jgi:hypothetical protein
MVATFMNIPGYKVCFPSTRAIFLESKCLVFFAFFKITSCYTMKFYVFTRLGIVFIPRKGL